jgi:hypothetical protein
MEITGLKKLQTMSKLGYIAARRPFMKRVKANVQLEYESSWKFYLQFLEQCHSLQEWLFIKGFEDKEILCNVNGKISFTS